MRLLTGRSPAGGVFERSDVGEVRGMRLATGAYRCPDSRPDPNCMTPADDLNEELD